MRRIYKYKPADKSKRPIRDLGVGKSLVTGKAGLYNENLTVDEIALLRNLIWDCKAENPKESHEFTMFIHTWMFTNRKIPIYFPDIADHLETGVLIEGFDP